MFLSDVSIKRPVFATMMNLVLIVFGLFSLPRLAVEQMPDVDFPVVTVTVLYPGADPESVEQRVLDPLEKAVNGISGLDKLSSNAFPNLAQLVLQFKLEKNSDQAAQEVRDKIFAAIGQLPDEAETPVVQKFDIAGAPIINIAMTGDGIPFGQLSKLAKDVVAPAIERVQGVASVNKAGIRERQVQIFVDREKLSSFGLTPADVVDSLEQQNLDMPAGKVQNETKFWSVRIKGKLANAEQIAQLPILSQASTNLRISDVATVKDEIAEEDTAAFVGNKPTILMSIQKAARANTTSVAADARKVIEKLGSQLPKGTHLEIVSDNSTYIKSSIDAVKLDLVLGALLATFIVFIFLKDVRITIISAIALPTAVIATFAFLQTMGFTLNMMTTLGLSLSIGILIDDAIIVIENIHRHLSMKKTGAQAAQDATSEIGLAVMATTLTICAVFVPVAFMEGIIGRFFYQFGLTVAFAVLVSLFVAFTLTPMLASRWLLEGEHHANVGWIKRFWEGVEAVLSSIDRAYRNLLEWCLYHRWTTLAGGLATFIFSIVLLKFVPVSFFPKEDKSQFNIEYTLPEGTTIDVSKRIGLDLSKTLQSYPGVKTVVMAIAATREKKPNMIRYDIVLVKPHDRNYSQDEFMTRLRQDLAPRFATNGSEILVAEAAGGGGGRSQAMQYIFKADDYDALAAYTEKVADYIGKNIPGAVDVTTTKPKTQKEFRIEVDSSRAADLAISTAQVGAAVRALYEGDKVGEIDDKGSRFDVRLRIADTDRLSADDLTGLALTNRRGQQITLGSIATIKESSAPSSIERFDGQRQITVLANFTGKDLNSAADKIQAHINDTMPPTITMSLSGQTEIMKNAIGAMLKALGIAILLVFMILCAQYERYLAPMVIMSALPLSLTGAFGALLITGQIMSVYTMIGIILLMGLVTKNGILLIDFTIQRIDEGKSVFDALMEAGPIRLRPILMTTFAAGGGMLPVAFGHGEGGEARSPMGVAVIGGLLVSTFLTLVVVPCAFSVVEQYRERFDIKRFFSKKKHREHAVSH